MKTKKQISIRKLMLLYKDASGAVNHLLELCEETARILGKQRGESLPEAAKRAINSQGKKHKEFSKKHETTIRSR